MKILAFVLIFMTLFLSGCSLQSSQPVDPRTNAERSIENEIREASAEAKFIKDCKELGGRPQTLLEYHCYLDTK